MSEQQKTIYIDNIDAINDVLAQPWGTTTVNGVVQQLCCPLCCALIPANYTNAHEVTETPQKRHSDTHRATAVLLAAARPRLGF